jgi:hypothetical protein
MTLTPADEAVDLNYWSNAESTVTIMAASIPILRVLVRDVKKSFPSRRYASGNISGDAATGKSKLGSSNTMFVAMADRNRSRTSEGTESELSILRGKESSLQGRIVRTNDYKIEFSRGG